MKFLKVIGVLFICAFTSMSLVGVLYAISEDIIHRNNSFIRRYPHHPLTKKNNFDLGYNSYYIAGFTKDSIYLGNHTAPLHMLSFDKDLRDSTHIKLDIERLNKYEFRSVKVLIYEPYFYFVDGSVPIIYKGRIGKWQGEIVMQDQVYFSQITTLGDEEFAFRARSAITNENELGNIHLDQDTVLVKLQPEILQKQIDGIFDSDGFLLYNMDLQKIIYTYRYRNEFISTDKDLQLDYRGKTIDTISYAQLDIAEVSSLNQRKIGPRSITVTHQAATSGIYLFLSSDRLGKYELQKMLSQARIIDVYNLNERIYEFSFYLYDFQKEKMREFVVQDDYLYMLAGNHLISHQLKQDYFNLNNIEDISADIRRKTENLK